MKNIAFFNSVMSWGGGEKWHYDAAIYFSAKGYKVHFYTRKDSELYKRLSDHGQVAVTTVKVTGTSFLNPFKILKLRNSFAAAQLDALIINLPNDVKLAAHAARLAAVPRIIYRRGSAIPIKNSILNRFAFKYWLTDILANSQATKETILRHNRQLFPDKRIKVIYNPVNVEAFIAQPCKPLYRKTDNEIVIGNLGRLEYEKNHQFLLRLSEELDLRRIRHKIIIGGTGRLEGELKEDAARRGVDQNILFCGFVSNVKDLLVSCDVFVLPSLWEGFGYVLAEASLCKKPIIGFNVSGIPEVVVDQKTGFLIADDVQECADRIAMLKADTALQTAMGGAGFEHIVSTFDKTKIMPQIENYIASGT
jgi:glycosyltransferase involved in cell wall biosynthesis